MLRRPTIEYTSAAGDNLNSGKTPDKPLASLQALLNRYQLGAGDIVYVDTGSYTLLQDVSFNANQSGTGNDPGQRITIQGATTAGDLTTLNRNNTGSDSAAINLAGGNYIAFRNLELTGGESGVREHGSSTSHDITFDSDTIDQNARDGAQFDYHSGYTSPYDILIENTKIFGQSSTALSFNTIEGVTLINNEIYNNGGGIWLNYTSQALVQGNVVHDNTQYGIYASDRYQSQPASLIADNRIFSNGLTYNYGPFGIQIEGDYITASDNTIVGQTGSGNVGLIVDDGATASGNVVSGNTTGVFAHDAGTTVTGNRIFENTTDGILLGRAGPVHVTANRIYSNGLGIGTTGFDSSSQALIDDNLIYLNSNGGIDLPGGIGSVIVGNTIDQPQDGAIRIEGGASKTTISDNILMGEQGSLLTITADSLSGLVTNYNLYYRGASGGATAATLGSAVYTTLADWRAADATRNANSKEGDPKFITPTGAGADNVLGGPDTALGGGADDNFTPGIGSPAIDAGDQSVLPATDVLGQPRHDDPATANTGSGQILSIGGYAPSDTGANAFSATGNAVLHGWSGAASYPLTFTLPFTFHYYDQTVTSVRLSSAGYIELDPNSSFAGAASPSVAALEAGSKIAPFWSNVDAVTGSDNIYADTSTAGQVKFTWIVRPTGAASTSQFSATLFADGSVQFDYGQNLTGLTPVIGLSGGSASTAVLAPNNGSTTLSNSHSIRFAPTGVVRQSYDDIGAVEFQGSSGDTVAPAIVSVSNLPSNGGKTAGVFTTVAIAFSEALDLTSATSPANFVLTRTDSGLTTAIVLTPAYDAAANTVVLTLAAPLADGSYQLEISPRGGLVDTAGKPLDAGSAYLRSFTVDRSANHAPQAGEIDVSATTAVSKPIMLTATDADGDPLTYTIISGPTHGTIGALDPTTHSFTYTSVDGFVGTDTIIYAVDDGHLGVTQASVVITVAAKVVLPVAITRHDRREAERGSRDPVRDAARQRQRSQWRDASFADGVESAARDGDVRSGYRVGRLHADRGVRRSRRL